MPQQFGEPQDPDLAVDSTFVAHSWFYRRRAAETRRGVYTRCRPCCLQRRVIEVRALVNLGFTQLLVADLAAAHQSLFEGLRLCRALQHLEGMGYCIGGLGILAARLGHDYRAMLLLTAARMTFETAGARMQTPEQRMVDEALLELQARMSGTSYAAARRRGARYLPRPRPQ